MTVGWFQLLIGTLHIVLAVGVSAHIVLTKSDVRGAIGWIGLVWLTPVVGSVLYLFLGINRIRRRAGRIRRDRTAPNDVRTHPGAAHPPHQESCSVPAPFGPLAALVGGVTRAPLTAGNSIEPLVNGDAAYPAMLAAIDGAATSIALATYIFDRGQVADRFLDALARAVERGVQVRVLIDGVGVRYSRPSILHALRRRKIPVALFLPSPIPLPHPYFNLRNHRKLLVVDGKVGFCGGLNIRDGCLLSLHTPDATQDMHFRLAGPVVRQLMSALAFDWRYTTGKQLTGDHWFPELAPAGEIPARGIPDGPDEDFEALLFTLLGALAQATRSVRIMTPYFLPDAPLLDALKVAGLRGAQVEIVLPERGNLRMVQWAQTAQLRRVLGSGCRVWLTPAPFDHSKLMVVDGLWSLIGSANWDPRSLRLNFEYVVEAYSAPFAARVNAVIDTKLAAARELTRAELDARSFPVRVRDGIAWLAQPYL